MQMPTHAATGEPPPLSPHLGARLRRFRRRRGRGRRHALQELAEPAGHGGGAGERRGRRLWGGAQRCLAARPLSTHLAGSAARAPPPPPPLRGSRACASPPQPVRQRRAALPVAAPTAALGERRHGGSQCAHRPQRGPERKRDAVGGRERAGRRGRGAAGAGAHRAPRSRPPGGPRCPPPLAGVVREQDACAGHRRGAGRGDRWAAEARAHPRAARPPRRDAPASRSRALRGPRHVCAAAARRAGARRRGDAPGTPPRRPPPPSARLLAPQLTSLGIDPACITFTNVTMESAKYICVRETGAQVGGGGRGGGGRGRARGACVALQPPPLVSLLSLPRTRSSSWTWPPPPPPCAARSPPTRR